MRIRVLPISVLLLIARVARGGDLDRQFSDRVQPFVQTYCVSCHSGEKPKGDFDITRFTSLDLITKDQQHWSLVLERLRDQEWPPEKAKKHPSQAERKQIIDWILAMRAV